MQNLAHQTALGRFARHWASTKIQYIMVNVLFLLPAFAVAASFDCKLAAIRVERLICANNDLSVLDDTLSEIVTLEVEQEEVIPTLRISQKSWLNARNGCANISCIQRKYEQRIAELSCSPKSKLAGSSIGSSQCAYFSLRLLESELPLLEERYSRKLADESNNPEYILRTAKTERDAWRSYRVARCALHGATEGGSDGWKNAFAGMCEVDETEKRIARLKEELVAK